MFFYDFEFNDNGQKITPISLGITTPEGDFELYFVNRDYVALQHDPETRTCNPWVFDNVIPGVYQADIPIIEKPQNEWGGILLNALEENFPIQFKGETWEFAGYYSSYDHVALAQLWGEMALLPTGMPMWSRDIKQWLNDLNDPDIDVPQANLHNAIADARWNRDVYTWLTKNFSHPAWDI
jgi:hypothetical protein